MRRPTNAIPPMTDPLGKHWEQPRDIRHAPMNGTHVLLDRIQFNQLHDYSASIPSGVYDGKCWRIRYRGVHYLRWYGPCADPKQCAIEQRIIAIGRMKTPAERMAPFVTPYPASPFYPEH